jgi:energy-coupling factor transport system permease protein
MKFYRDITLGQYVPGGSVVHRVEAGTKVIELIGLIVSIFLVREPLSLALLFLFSVWILVRARISLRYVLRGMKPFTWLFVFIFFVQFLTVPGRMIPPFNPGFVKMTYSGLKEGTLVSSQVALSIIFSSILTLTTSPMELAKGVFRILSPLRVFRVPIDDVVLVIMISLRYVPLFLGEIERITRAQRARGGYFDEGNLLQRAKRVLLLVAPLLANSLRKAHGIGEALAIRGYGEGSRWPAGKGDGLGREGWFSLAITGGIISLVVFVWFMRKVL